jgi:uncharacterized iron-regulated protein
MGAIGLLWLTLALSACAPGSRMGAATPALGNTSAALDGLLPAHVLLLGEQHDAPEHQQRQREVLDALIAQRQAAALVIEMAEQGGDTRQLPAHASEADARQALGWSASEAAGWDWAVYGPLVMRAVRAGVPVWGGNLPRAQLRHTMQDAALDNRLTAPALKTQQNQIREGHCQLLPESQIGPMTRVQIARDHALASTAEGAMRTGQTVLLVAGNQHVRRDLGVPVHLSPQVKARVVLMQSGRPSGNDNATAGTSTDANAERTAADQIWQTAPVPVQDHCAEFKARMGR